VYEWDSDTMVMERLLDCCFLMFLFYFYRYKMK
jgi:hypothetical protein